MNNYPDKLADIPSQILDAFQQRAFLGIPQLAPLLDMDIKTLRKHIAAGELVGRYKGTGTIQRTRVFTLADVVKFLRRPSTTNSETACQSSGSKRRRSGNSISRSTVVDITDRLKSAAKPKHSNSRKRNTRLPSALLLNLQRPAAGP